MPEDDRVNAVKEWAEPIAKKIINEGFFSIGNHYCIRVDILELYYNEEAEGGLSGEFQTGYEVQNELWRSPAIDRPDKTQPFPRSEFIAEGRAADGIRYEDQALSQLVCKPKGYVAAVPTA